MPDQAPLDGVQEEVAEARQGSPDDDHFRVDQVGDVAERAADGEPRIVEPTKAAALAWFALDQLPDPVVPHELMVLQGLTTGIPPYSTFGFDPLAG